MLKKAQQALRRLFAPQGQEELSTSPHEKATFLLQFGTLEVGLLDLREGVWEFHYSPAFREQVEQAGGVHPLVDFPDSDRTYKSEELWPFFMARIPSTAQPQVLAEIQKQGLDQKSAVQLLKAFGERSIANPFLLRSA